jgi:hypothetical protein
MASSSRFAGSTRKLEEPPSDGGLTVNALTGWLRRGFFRIARLEKALEFVIARVEELERAPGKTTTAKSDISRTPNELEFARPLRARRLG